MTTVGDWRLHAVLRRFRKLKGRSVDELRERAAQAFSAELEFRGLASTVGEPSDRALWASLSDDRMAGTGENAGRLHAHFSSRAEPAFFSGIRDGASAAALRSPRWAAERAQLIAAADAVLAGQFDLLGHGGLSFGSPIDWHLDPVSNRRAPRIHWSRIAYLNADLIGDHKVIWEINRHQHFFILGRAYQVSGGAEYARCFVEHLTSWMDANPPKTGVNWASSLEVAYRAIAWLWALELFRGAPALTPDVMTRALKYLYIHGRHLERYLSTYFSPNTHLTGEALGLLYLGILLPEFRRADQWRKLGWRILEEELPRQVHGDGVYFEQASYYHRYTLDIYLHALLLAERNGVAVAAPMRERLWLAAEHLADLTRPDGTMPIIGDDDGGSLVLLEERAFADVRSTLATASVMLARPELAAVAGVATEEVLWLLGPEGVARIEATLSGAHPSHLSRLFPQGGYAIMRDGWKRGSMHAVIDCGPLGALNCGHAHSDALSIEIAAGGCSILVDPGTYTYTSTLADRDHFRHSAAHNTVTVDGESASVTEGPFSWAHRADATIDAWWTGSRVDRFAGSHRGFERLSSPAVHRRSVVFMRGEYWMLVDTLLADGAHELTAHFHAAEGSRAETLSAFSARIETSCADGEAGLFFGVAGDGQTLEWGEDWVSPSYGSRTRAPYARVTSRGSGRQDLVTLLCPAHRGDAVDVRQLPADQGRAVLVSRLDTHDLFLFETGGSARAHGVEMNADAAVVRRTSPQGQVEFMALFGADARLDMDDFSFRASGAAEAVRKGDGWLVEGEGRVTVRG